MSIMKLMGVRSWVLSFVEIVFFFGVVSTAYFGVLLGGYQVGASVFGSDPVEQATTTSAPASQAATAAAPAAATAPAQTQPVVAEASATTQPAAGQAASSPASQSRPAYSQAPTAAASQPGGKSRGWLASTPVWMWIIAGVGYVLLVTLYWAPGDGKLDDAELRAFAVFVAVVVIGGLVFVNVQYDGAVTSQLKLFWTIVSGHYQPSSPATAG